MKKLFLSFFLILFVSTSAFGEPDKQTYSNGDYYIGEVNSNNQRHGSGVYYHDDGIIRYIGDWRNGESHGYGIWYGKSGDKFAGDFLYGKRKGHGTYTYKNGDKFIGEEPEGFGRLYDFSKGTSKLVKYKNNKYTNASFSEANFHFETGKRRHVKANQASNKARLEVDKYKNKTSSTTSKWQQRYCKKTNGIIYYLYGYQCKAGELEISKYQYENYIKNIPDKSEIYEINQWYYSHALKLRIRSNPDLINSKIVGYLNKGDMIYVSGKIINEPWYIVKYDNKVAYVSKTYLKKDKPVTQTTTQSTTKKTETRKIKKKKKIDISNPGVWVTIGIVIFLFLTFARGGKKKTSRYKSSPDKSSPVKKTTYVSKTSKSTSSTESAKTYTHAKKRTPVGGKKTSRVTPMIIKKSKKTGKKGLICKYCDTENKYTAVTCISCNKSLS